ncbi:CD151 antigen-like [Babylonia areolata]|uniref:CD151 antigen-like n=1 Tax=Babylonia areolata TaxID=304850 RepID=UPI003FD24AB6
MNCGASFARMLLIIFNFIFWLSGVAILGVGIWILVDPNLEDKIDVIHTGDQEYFKHAAYLLLAFGAFIFLVGFSGCCGAIRNSKCLLGLYIFFLVLVFAGELAAGILAAVYKDKLEDEFKKGIIKSIEEDYLKNPDSFDAVQKELECCGASGPKDYENSTWYKENEKKNISYEIPASCCKPNVNLKDCQERTDQDSFYKEGCQDKLVEWMEDHSTILIGVGCGIAALQIFGLVFAICLCRSIDDEKN